MGDQVTPYPVRVDAVIGAHLSRWCWLHVPLATPHRGGLGLMSVPFPAVGVAASFATSAMGSRPCFLFDLTIGLLRQAWCAGCAIYRASAACTAERPGW